MAEKLAYDLVSPERKLASGQADSVQLPGTEGEMTAMARHAPVITTLRPGVVSVNEGGTSVDYVVTGGFAELAGVTLAVLAEEAVRREEVTTEWLTAKIDAAVIAEQSTEGQFKIIAAQRLNDFRFLKARLGL